MKIRHGHRLNQTLSPGAVKLQPTSQVWLTGAPTRLQNSPLAPPGAAFSCLGQLRSPAGAPGSEKWHTRSDVESVPGKTGERSRIGVGGG